MEPVTRFTFTLLLLPPVIIVGAVPAFPSDGPGKVGDVFPLDRYLQVLRQQGQEPIPFVIGKLDTFDLLIFDDALHIAVEPFEFY
jgi:hypothetical protein